MKPLTAPQRRILEVLAQRGALHALPLGIILHGHGQATCVVSRLCGLLEGRGLVQREPGWVWRITVDGLEAIATKP